GRFDFSMRAFFANARLLLLCEGQAHELEELVAFFVGLSGRHDRHLHPPDLINLVVVDFGEDELFTDAEAVIAPAIKSVWVQPLEITNARQRSRDKAVQEFVHAHAAKRRGNSDWVPFTQTKVCNGAARPRNHGLLAGDRGNIFHRFIEGVRVGQRFAKTDIHNDLCQARNLHDVAVLVLLAQRRRHFGIVLFTHTRDDGGCRCHSMSSPLFLPTRTSEPSSRRRNVTLVGWSLFGSISITLLIWIGASRWMIADACAWLFAR